MIVYMLYHVTKKVDAGDDEKLIGIYSSEENANAAIRRLRGLPGFKQAPEGFEIFEHVLDRDGWTEGYIPADEA